MAHATSEQRLRRTVIFTEREDDEILPSSLYDCKGSEITYDRKTESDIAGFRSMDKASHIAELFPYDKTSPYEDGWVEKNLGSTITTKHFHYDQNKLNYVINYYVAKNGDMSTYPFENDPEAVKSIYKSLAKWQGSRVFDEIKLKNALDELGLDEITISVDWKGDLNIETGGEVDKEKLTQKLTNIPGDAYFGFKSAVFFESEKGKVRSEGAEGQYALFGTLRWALNHRYGVLLEDLSISDNGDIAGLPDEVYKKYGDNELYYDDIRAMIRNGGDSSEILATIKYVNGNIYIK